MAGLREFEIEGEIRRKRPPRAFGKDLPPVQTPISAKAREQVSNIYTLRGKKTYNIGNGATRARNKLVEMLRDRLIRKQRSTKMTGFLFYKRI